MDNILIGEFMGGVVEQWYPPSTLYPSQSGKHMVYPIGENPG